MCERCERSAAIQARGLEDTLFAAADARAAAVVIASTGGAVEEGAEIANPTSDAFMRAVAAQMGVHWLDVAQVAMSMGDTAMVGVADGFQPVLCVEGAAAQALLFGWLLRDEQLKAERAENAPAT